MNIRPIGTEFDIRCKPPENETYAVARIYRYRVVGHEPDETGRLREVVECIDVLDEFDTMDAFIASLPGA